MLKLNKLPIGSSLMDVFVVQQLRHLSEIAVASFFWSAGQAPCPSFTCPACNCAGVTFAPTLSCPSQPDCLCGGEKGTRVVSDSSAWAKGFLAGILVGCSFAVFLIIVCAYFLQWAPRPRKGPSQIEDKPAISTPSSSPVNKSSEKVSAPPAAVDIAALAAAQAAHFRKK